MLLNAIPTLFALNINDTIVYYDQRLGFKARYHEGGFAILVRDAVEINFTQTDDKHLIDNTSCRITVTDVDSLYQEFKPHGVIHPNGALETTWWGTKEFAVLDLNGNCITFTQRLKPPEEAG